MYEDQGPFNIHMPLHPFGYVLKPGILKSHKNIFLNHYYLQKHWKVTILSTLERT